MEVLILGGTGEARELAQLLHADGLRVTTSLAGRTTAAAKLAGEVRTGGFGGPAGLARHLDQSETDALIDATHPFAARMSANAVQAAAAIGTPLLRLERPGWSQGPGDRWHRARDLAAAAALAPRLGARILLTLGSHGVEAFAAGGASRDSQDPGPPGRTPASWYLIRAIERPQGPLPPEHELLLDRGPFTEPLERDLLTRHRIDLVVSRDAGGPQTAAKLAAARALEIPVLLVDRPRRPPAPASATTPQAARDWVRSLR